MRRRRTENKNYNSSLSRTFSALGRSTFGRLQSKKLSKLVCPCLTKGWHRLMLIAFLMLSPIGLNSMTIVEMGTTKEYYCEYCGHRFPDVRQLVSASCSRHPSGPNKGKHKLYEGTTKSKYTCKYCGRQFPTIMVMTGGTCANHPNGSNKGQHAPAL